VFKKQGDNKKIGEPEYQVCPSSDFDRESNTNNTVFL